MHTGVIRPRGVNIGNRRLIGAEMEGCQVRDWIVGERDMPCSKKCFNGRLWEIIGVIYPSFFVDNGIAHSISMAGCSKVFFR